MTLQTLYTESGACDMYKQAICDHRDMLESSIPPRPWVSLKNSGCLRQDEIDDIENNSSGSAGQITELVDFILRKHDINTYARFCKAVYTMKKVKDRAEKIFPFANSLGGLSVTEPQKALPPSCESPVVLWLVSSETDCTRTISLVGCEVKNPRRHVGAYTCQEFFVADKLSLAIHIAYPSGQSATTMTDPVDLLFRFSPRPHVTVMTGTCCANDGEANLGDVCVVTPQSEGVWGETSLLAELQHMTELWSLRDGGSLLSEDLKPPRSVYQQIVCLARISHELQLSEAERSQWFRNLRLDITQPLSDNPGVRRCIPDIGKLLQSEAVSRLWGSGNPLLHVPCDKKLCDEARSSIQFASQSHSFISDPVDPHIIFGRASIFKQTEGTSVCSTEVANFYKAALMVNKRCGNGMPYLAALGVSSVDGQDCVEDEYEQFATLFSIHFMWKIVNHLFKKMHV